MQSLLLRLGGGIGDLDIGEVFLADGAEGVDVNTNRDSAKRQPGHRILNQVRPTSTQEGRTGTVVLSVVCRVENSGGHFG